MAENERLTVAEMPYDTFLRFLRLSLSPKRQNVMNKICNKRKAAEICKFVYSVASHPRSLPTPPPLTLALSFSLAPNRLTPVVQARRP